MFELSAWIVSLHPQRPCHVRHQSQTHPLPELVLGYGLDRGLLGRRLQILPPHSSDLHALCPTGSIATRRRRRIAGPLHSPSTERRRLGCWVNRTRAFSPSSNRTSTAEFDLCHSSYSYS